MAKYILRPRKNTDKPTGKKFVVKKSKKKPLPLKKKGSRYT